MLPYSVMKTNVLPRPGSLAFFVIFTLLSLDTGCVDSSGDMISSNDLYAGFERQEYRYQLPDGRIAIGTGIRLGDQLLISGDMLIPVVASKGSISQAVATTNLWPQSRVIYEFDPALDAARRQNVLNAMNPWKSAGIVFTQRTNQSWYVHITTEHPSYPLSCAVDIGFQGVSTYYASNACGTHDFVHEWGHVLGLFHEHERNDRDQFVWVDTTRINATLASQGRASYELSPYDFGSIMHYNAYARHVDGSIDYDDVIIRPLDGRPLSSFGFNETPSSYDLGAIQSMYWSDPPCGPGTGRICP